MSRPPANPALIFILRLLLVATLITPSLATGVSGLATDSNNSDSTASTSTREGRLAVFDDVWSTISERYYDRAFSELGDGLTWEAQRTTFRALAGEANSPQDLYAVLRRMIASLNDPHTRVFSPAERFDWWRPRFITIGLTLKEVGGLPTVVQVKRGSEPQRSGIVVGDVIDTVNGKSALSLIRQKLDDYPVVSAHARDRAFANLVDGPPASVVEVGWIEKDGKKRSAKFERYWEQREPGVRVRRQHGYAIVEIDSFTVPVIRTFNEDLKKKLNKVKGIVLDFRRNSGGDAEAMADLASVFLSPGTSLGQFIDRSGTSYEIFTRSKSPLIAERLTKTSLPMVVLTGERTSSAAEIFVAGLRASGRATIIGSETCGCVLAIRARHDLPDGGLLDISELDYRTASGERLEKSGVKPDETIAVERNDLYSRRDRALSRAFDTLKGN